MAIALWMEGRDTARRITFPFGTVESDRMHQFMGFVNSSFYCSIQPLWAALEMSPEPVAQAVLSEFGRRAVAKRHEQLEAIIGHTPFLLDNRPTLADAMLAGVGRWLEFPQVFDVGRYPRLRRAREKVEADPAAVFARGIEFPLVVSIGPPRLGVKFIARLVREGAVSTLESIWSPWRPADFSLRNGVMWPDNLPPPRTSIDFRS